MVDDAIVGERNKHLQANFKIASGAIVDMGVIFGGILRGVIGGVAQGCVARGVLE